MFFHFLIAYLIYDNHYYMKLNAIIHTAEDGGYWAEVPALPGCVTQGETIDLLIHNIYEAVQGCLSISIEPPGESTLSF